VSSFPVAGGRPLVLVVDDDPDILDAVCDILEGERYRVSRARHGQEALERVAEERPAIVLLDLMMPVMDGVAFAHALRARYTDDEIPIVVISADGNPQRAAAVGARGFLAKPFDIDALLDEVASVTASGLG
jgi:two-component system, chemotaxis family, chemotaxis protein CheY